VRQWASIEKNLSDYLPAVQLGKEGHIPPNPGNGLLWRDEQNKLKISIEEIIEKAG
jgi:hypothetical protein